MYRSHQLLPIQLNYSIQQKTTVNPDSRGKLYISSGLHSGALGLAFLGLEVVVAGALFLVADRAGRDTQAPLAAVVAQEITRLLVRCRRAADLAFRRAFCSFKKML